MSWNEVADTLCPIARGTSVVGERWTLLIMREIAMGVRKFDDIQAQTGMSSPLLATRLKQLEAEGIVERREYNKRPKRYEYFATQKGGELDAVLLALHAWGLKWGQYTPEQAIAMKIFVKKTGEQIGENIRIMGSSEIFSFEDTEIVMSDDYAEEREWRRTEFLRRKRMKASESD